MSVGSTLIIPESLRTSAIVPRAGAVDSLRLARSFEECARITRTRARNFYHGLKLTPEPRRGAIYSIYAWMRAADDEADTPTALNERHARLRTYRQLTERVLAGETPGHDWAPFWPAFAATAWSYPIDPAIFRDMLDGLDEDLDHAAYESDDTLSRYCYRVAGTAGLACVWIWGLRDGADPALATQLALRRGQAFQRTNILRDFAQDFDGAPSRVYIPASALAAHGLDAPALRAWRDDARCSRLIQEQAAIAREHYRASDALVGMVDPACAPTLWAMTRIYSGLLELIEAHPRRVVSDKRIRLSGLEKASIALTAAIKSRTAAW